jgi:hypothetical protein
MERPSSSAETVVIFLHTICIRDMVPRCPTGWIDSKLCHALSLNVNGLVHCDAHQHQGIELLQRTLADEAFALFELTHEYEFRYASLDALISRIKEIYSSTDPVMDVNLPSRQGDTLLKLCVSSYHLEEDPDAQLDLVRFILKCGADPNLEDSMGETSLDWLLDHHFQCHNPLSVQHEEMILLLAERGALLHLTDSQGRRWGKRQFSLEDLQMYKSRLCGNGTSSLDR